MSFPETCPFCGEGVEGKSERWVTFACFTMIENGIDARQFQAATCKDSERLQLIARLAALEAENKALRDRVAELDTERKGAQIAIRGAYASASRAADMRAAGNALARHVAQDNRGHTARQLVQAREEASR